MCAVGDEPGEGACRSPFDDATSLQWRVERARLEQSHSNSLRQRPRRYLSFSQASNWAQTLGLQSKREYYEFLEMGEGLSSYVPRDPEQYYSEKGTWLGWIMFLTGSPSVCARE